jgi:hypothetical protein
MKRTWRGNTMKMLLTWAAATLAAGLLAGVSAARADDDVIRFGITAPMSGAAASWGIGADWVGQQAVKWINEHGGITAAGKTYKVALTTYENGYHPGHRHGAGEGAAEPVRAGRRADDAGRLGQERQGTTGAAHLHLRQHTLRTVRPVVRPGEAPAPRSENRGIAHNSADGGKAAQAMLNRDQSK